MAIVQAARADNVDVLRSIPGVTVVLRDAELRRRHENSRHVTRAVASAGADGCMWGVAVIFVHGSRAGQRLIDVPTVAQHQLGKLGEQVSMADQVAAPHHGFQTAPLSRWPVMCCAGSGRSPGCPPSSINPATMSCSCCKVSTWKVRSQGRCMPTHLPASHAHHLYSSAPCA